jgi:hypothetical protein
LLYAFYYGFAKLCFVQLFFVCRDKVYEQLSGSFSVPEYQTSQKSFMRSFVVKIMPAIDRPIQYGVADPVESPGNDQTAFCIYDRHIRA